MSERRIALITGGSRGIGRAIAEALAQAVIAAYGRADVLVNNAGVRSRPVRSAPRCCAKLSESMDSERADAFVRSVPVGRTGAPEEIAAVVAFLVTDAASYVTGQVLYVNGCGPGS